MIPIKPPLSQSQKDLQAPRTASEKKRLKILNAASALFSKQGFPATGMKQIADEAGTSKQTVYSHFGSKEGVFVASITTKLLHGVLPERIFDEHRPIHLVLLDLARYINQIMTDSEAPHIARLCAANAENHPKLPKILYNSGAKRMKAVLSEILRKRTELHELAIPDIEIAAEQFIYMIQAEEAYLCMLRLPSRRSPEEQEEYLQQSVDMFMAAYKIDK